jgi:hypothetical protein
VEEYNGFEEECNPSLPKMSKADFERLFEEVKKNAVIVGNSLSLPTLKGLISFLVSQELSLPKDSGSTS